MKIIIYRYSPILVLLVLFLFGNKALAATLTLSPGSRTITSGQTITLDILLDTQGALIDGVDVYSLHYNPSILEVVDENAGTSGVQIIPGSLLPITLTNTASNGIIQFSQVSSGGTSYTGSGKLATITFKGLANGTSQVTFDFTPGSTSDSNVAGAGQDKLSSVVNATITVTDGTETPPTPTPTPTPSNDTTPPVISSIISTSITSNSANIVWTTDEGATSKIDYGQSSSYGSVTSYNASSITLHSQTITSLKANTTYHFRVRSQDDSGNLSVSSDNTFTTTPATGNTTYTPPPTTSTYKPTITNGKVTTGDSTFTKISSIHNYSIGTSTATITWTTDQSADSQIEYGDTDSYSSFSEKDEASVTAHKETLYDLSQGTTYHFRVRSRNSLGKLSFSDDRTFTTLKEIIVQKNIVQKFFEWIFSWFL